MQWRGGAPRRRYQPLPSSPRGVSEIPEDGGYDEAEQVHSEEGDSHAAVPDQSSSSRIQLHRLFQAPEEIYIYIYI